MSAKGECLGYAVAVPSGDQGVDEDVRQHRREEVEKEWIQDMSWPKRIQVQPMYALLDSVKSSGEGSEVEVELEWPEI